MTDRTLFAIGSLGTLALFVGLFVRTARRDLAQAPPEHRGNDLSLAILAGLSLVFRLLPLFIGVGLACVILRRIAGYLARLL